MNYYFFDSSATVKNYISETRTNWVKSVFAGIPKNEILMASITEVEVVAAISEVYTKLINLKIDFNTSTFTFVSADVELNSAAQNEGLTVENPNSYP